MIPTRYVAQPADVKIHRAGRRGPIAGIGHVQRMHGDVVAERRTGQADVVLKRLVVDAGDHFGIVIALPAQVMVVARAQHRALAAYRQVEQAGRYRPGIHIGVAAVEIERVALRIQRYMVTGAVDADLAGIGQAGRILQAQHMIQPAYIGMLVLHCQVIAPGVLVTRVVDTDTGNPRFFVGNLQYRIHLIVLVAALQLQRGLFRRVFVCHLQAGRDLREVRRFAFAQPGQASAYVGFVKVPIAFHRNLADPGFYHLQMHDAAIKLLLRQHHLHNVVAFLPVGGLQRFQRHLHRTEIALLARIRRQQLIHHRARQQRVALHLKPDDLEPADRAAAFRFRLHHDCARHDG